MVCSLIGCASSSCPRTPFRCLSCAISFACMSSASARDRLNETMTLDFPKAWPLARSGPIRTRFASDSPLEEAVACEPVSEAKFPASREFTGSFHPKQRQIALNGSKVPAKSA